MFKRFQRFSWLPLVFSIVGLLAVGCSKKPDGPPRYETHGIVTYLGKPVEEVQVVFYATDPGGVSRSAVVDEKGNFRIIAVVGNGLPEGEYTVVVRPRPGGDLEIINDADYDHPKKYWKKGTSDLKFPIVEGENDLKIVLTD